VDARDTLRAALAQHLDATQATRVANTLLRAQLSDLATLTVAQVVGLRGIGKVGRAGLYAACRQARGSDAPVGYGVHGPYDVPDYQPRWRWYADTVLGERVEGVAHSAASAERQAVYAVGWD
jgi:hypothetical protein